MTVYVDQAVHPYRQMLMCHMWADTEAELFAMVDTIGVARRWIQRPPKASWIHFDISKGKRDLAIRAGAIQTDKYGPLEHLARLVLASGDRDKAARATLRLEQIARNRERAQPQGELGL